MKYLLFVISILAFATLSASASHSNTTGKTRKAYQSIPSSSSYVSPVQRNVVSRILPWTTQSSKEGDAGTKMQQGTDLAMHCSIVPGADASLVLLAVLNFVRYDDIPRLVRHPARPDILKVLFRAFISPNAP